MNINSSHLVNNDSYSSNWTLADELATDDGVYKEYEKEAFVLLKLWGKFIENFLPFFSTEKTHNWAEGKEVKRIFLLKEGLQSTDTEALVLRINEALNNRGISPKITISSESSESDDGDDYPSLSHYNAFSKLDENWKKHKKFIFSILEDYDTNSNVQEIFGFENGVNEELFKDEAFMKQCILKNWQILNLLFYTEERASLIEPYTKDEELMLQVLEQGNWDAFKYIDENLRTTETFVSKAIEKMEAQNKIEANMGLAWSIASHIPNNFKTADHPILNRLQAINEYVK